MIVVESAGRTDIGKRRKENEDTLLIDDVLGLYAVADGVGGHQAGKVASLMVVETMVHMMKKLSDSNDREELIKHDSTLSPSANHLISAIHLSNEHVYKSANSREDYQGMCSTVSAVYFTHETMIAANVGDSPIYLVRKGNIELLSVPHTSLCEQVLPGSEGAKHMGGRYKNVLTQAMGIHQIVMADVCEIQCFAGDTVVLCSDGLSHKLHLNEISHIVSHNQPEKACRSLIDLANKRGGDDNITVIVVTLDKITNGKNMMKGFVSRVFSHKKRN